ncbi:MAG: F-type H+-transporting ATPase subunit b [Thermoleophilaceae bacterium]|nr:F-type H+-transporting ATPase subunit b [Thermoleophilaceae bacterium]
MEGLTDILLLAATEGEEGGGSFLVSPNVGLMIWTLLAFGATLFLLNKLAFPRIAEALDKRRRLIDESITAAESAKREADELLEEYRARLREAREQAEDILARARKAADGLADEAKAEATRTREELLANTRRDIESETRRALDEIRKEVADLTLIATEKVTRKSLTPDDHRRLIEEALSEVDFSTLAHEGTGR